MNNGAPKHKACKVIGISIRTLQRWSVNGQITEDLRPIAKRPEPSNKLTDVERQQILDTCNSLEFAGFTPNQIVPELADRKIYIASEASFYRVLKAHNPLDSIDVDYVPSIKNVREAADNLYAAQSLDNYTGLIKPKGLINVDRISSQRRGVMRVPDLNPISKVSIFCNSLHTATAATLEAQCGRTDELPQIEQLKKVIVEITGKTPAELKAGYSHKLNNRVPLLNFLNNLCTKLNDNNLNEIGALYDDKKTKLKAAEIVRKNTLNDLPIEGIGNDAWKQMWRYTQTFIAGLNNSKSFPPIENEHCPTCLQSISNLAAERMARFNDYIVNQTQRDADKATKTFDLKINEIKQLGFGLEPYKGILGEIRHTSPDAIKRLDNLMGQLIERKIKLDSETPIFTHDALDFNFVERLSKQIETIKTTSNKIVDDGSLAKMIKDNTDNLIELEDKQKLSSHKENILNEIERIKLFTHFNSALPSTNLTPITRFITTLAKTGRLGQINDAFSKELKALNFKNFKVETKTNGSLGQQKLTLQITQNSNKISNIASEGEQKCIALAGFMAELTIDNRKSAIIFDDPVNSLDHKWRRKFAQRIAEESKTRQVIVLTHDLPFLMMLNEESESPVNTQSITRRGGFSGFPQEKPPWDIIKTADRIKELKLLEVELRRYSNSNDFIEDIYKKDAKYIYGKMRETWERLVEEWLIRNVVQRFSRKVQTNNIRYLVDCTEEDVNAINAGMTKCSTYFEGHDTATGLGVTDMPEIDELKEDVDQLETYLGLLKTRRNKS